MSASISNAPIAVNADSFLADLNGETGTYTGNVIVTQGMIRLHADKVKVDRAWRTRLENGSQGHVVVDSPSGQAVGDNGFYDVPSQILRLNGNVVLTKDANVMRGSALEISMATGIARLTAAGNRSRKGRGSRLPAAGPRSRAFHAGAARRSTRLRKMQIHQNP